MIFTGRIYRVGKFVAQLVLPALATLYFIARSGNAGLSETFLEVVVIADLCLGVALLVSRRIFQKHVGRGTMHVTETDKGTTYLIELNNDPEYELQGKREVRLAVRKRTR